MIRTTCSCYLADDFMLKTMTVVWTGDS